VHLNSYISLNNQNLLYNPIQISYLHQTVNEKLDANHALLGDDVKHNDMYFPLYPKAEKMDLAW
jgi:hypothetical protein